MKSVKLLALMILIFGSVRSQCIDIKYKVSSEKCYTIKDTINFIAANLCKTNKFVLYSLEYYDSTGNWQEIDNDIFTFAPKGMKIIKLVPSRKQKFSFSIAGIDNSFFKMGQEVAFRIIENLYSADKIQIIQTKTVKKFKVGCKLI